jgi:hypothetical protein
VHHPGRPGTQATASVQQKPGPQSGVSSKSQVPCSISPVACSKSPVACSISTVLQVFSGFSRILRKETLNSTAASARAGDMAKVKVGEG